MLALDHPLRSVISPRSIAKAVNKYSLQLARYQLKVAKILSSFPCLAVFRFHIWLYREREDTS